VLEGVNRRSKPGKNLNSAHNHIFIYNSFYICELVSLFIKLFIIMAKYNETDSTTINLISSGTEITGDIKSAGDIRIDGGLTGNLNTKGKVVIGPTGRIKGEVVCKNSEVSGIIEGKISVNQLLNLKASSKILGDITTSRLSIEPGAKFTGNCKMSDNEEYEGGAATKGKEPEKQENRQGK
jgi:cytoskeletal protein CcmA (bactofilin family)